MAYQTGMGKNIVIALPQFELIRAHFFTLTGKKTGLSAASPHHCCAMFAGFPLQSLARENRRTPVFSETALGGNTSAQQFKLVQKTAVYIAEKHFAAGLMLPKAEVRVNYREAYP